MSVLPSYRNQSIDLHSKSIDWFLYEGNTGISWVNLNNRNDARNICYHNPVWYLKIRLDECHEGVNRNMDDVSILQKPVKLIRNCL